MSAQTKIERILRFISIISGRQELTVDELAREMDTTRRTVYRYLGTLDNCGFTIEKKGRSFSLRGMPVGDGDRLVMLTGFECSILGNLLKGYDDDPVIKGLLRKLAQSEEKEKGPGGHEFVDLGLPSGTLWATCNTGASRPEECGDYFAWGETETKQEFSWKTYRWSVRGRRFLSKYCTRGSEGLLDKAKELEACDDAAFLQWGDGWMMPTKRQFLELCGKCDAKWTVLDGVRGMQFTSRKNGNSIFLPASGRNGRPAAGHRAMKGCYWTRNLSWKQSCLSAAVLEFPVSGLPVMSDCTRESGLYIRPVMKAGSELTPAESAVLP